MTWAFDEKANSWDQLPYQGNYYQESVIDERTHYSGQFVPFSPDELVENEFGIPLKCRGDTAWILAYPN